MPTNSAIDKATVFSPEGNPITTSRLNCKELVEMGGYRWSTKTTAPAEPAPEPEPEPVVQDSDEDPEKETEADVLPPVAEEEAISTPTLSKEAKNVGDFDNVEDYLETFTVSNLRTLLEERYDVKAHGRTGKEKLIEMVLDAESEANE